MTHRFPVDRSQGSSTKFVWNRNEFKLQSCKLPAVFDAETSCYICIVGSYPTRFLFDRRVFDATRLLTDFGDCISYRRQTFSDIQTRETVSFMSNSGTRQRKLCLFVTLCRTTRDNDSSENFEPCSFYRILKRQYSNLNIECRICCIQTYVLKS